MLRWLKHNRAASVAVDKPCPSRGLDLPKRREDIPDWVPPMARPASRQVYVRALVSMMQDAGMVGIIEHWRFSRLADECWWLNGLEPITEVQLLTALGQGLKRVRPRILNEDGDRVRVTCYLIEDPEAVNVVRLPKSPSKVRGQRTKTASRSKERAERVRKAA